MRGGGGQAVSATSIGVSRSGLYLERIADKHKVSWKPMKALTAESMTEPTAAPNGFSVQVGTGSGLVEVAKYNVTGK